MRKRTRTETGVNTLFIDDTPNDTEFKGAVHDDYESPTHQTRITG